MLDLEGLDKLIDSVRELAVEEAMKKAFHQLLNDFHQLDMKDFGEQLIINGTDGSKYRLEFERIDIADSRDKN